MSTTIPSLFDYKIESGDLARLGRIVIIFSHALFFIDQSYYKICLVSQANKRLDVESKIKAMRKHARLDNETGIDELLCELRWALRKTLLTRNMIAHGIILTSDEGNLSFWSQDRLNELSISEILSLESLFDYILWVSVFLHWKLHNIQPHKSLPKRPVIE